MKIILQKIGPYLMAVDEESAAVLARIKEGAEVTADVRRARNINQLRLFWSLVDIVAQATDLPNTTIKKDCLIGLGFTETWIGVDSRVHVEAKSIAVENMEQDEFDAFMGRAVNLMAGWIGTEQTDLMRRFNELAADKRYEGMRR